MENRYEEYSETKGGIPFVLYEGIKRSASLVSDRQNWHENLEFQFCESGDGFVLIDGERYALNEGMLALVDSGAIHYTYSNTAMRYSCLIVGTAFCRQMGIDYGRLSFTPLVRDERLTARFRELCEEYKKESPLRTARLCFLLLAFLMEAVERHARERAVTAGEGKEIGTVKRVLSYLRENFHTHLTLDGIAREVLTDKYTLCKIFKKNTGQTIFENLNAYRCMKAAEYIESGVSVSAAAERCGFENRSFFTRMFKRYIGVLPSKMGK